MFEFEVLEDEGSRFLGTLKGTSLGFEVFRVK
jgi:hypothetical protein